MFANSFLQSFLQSCGLANFLQGINRSIIWRLNHGVSKRLQLLEVGVQRSFVPREEFLGRPLLLACDFNFKRCNSNKWFSKFHPIFSSLALSSDVLKRTPVIVFSCHFLRKADKLHLGKTEADCNFAGSRGRGLPNHHR